MTVAKSRLLALFERLVSIDSPSFGEREMCDFIKERLARLGLTAREDSAAEKLGGTSGNLYCYVEGELEKPPLLFSGHMDTVEPARGKKLVRGPGGLLTSAGDTVLGADDLAGVAAILEALETLLASGEPHRPLELLFSAAEEPYCVGVLQYDFSSLKSREAYVFDLTGPVGGAAYQAPTILSFTAVFSGRAAHAGFSPEEGVHAIQAAARAIAQIPCGRVGEATVNIATISGGTASNIVPDRCSFTGEIRSFSDGEARRLLEEMRETMERAAAENGASVRLESVSECTAYCTDRSHPVVKRFEDACGALGLPVRLCQTFGGSDNNHFATHGITGIVVANAMNNCHSCGEYTSEEELERAANLALRLMTAE